MRISTVGPVAVALMAALVAAGCKRGRDDEPKPVAVTPAKEPVRTAVADRELRVLLAELAAAKACELVSGQFQGLKDSKRPDVMTGTLWLRDCKVTQDGTRVTFVLKGNGWQWGEGETKKAGGRFTLGQYLRFAVTARLTGTLDVGYDPGAHVASLWFTPVARPEIAFEPVGDIDVERHGTWSAIVGGLSTLIGSSPEAQAADKADDKGTTQFAKQFGRGFSATIELCRGVVRFGLGRPGKGKMVPKTAGETQRIGFELEKDALAIFGPYPAQEGFTLAAEIRGNVRTELLCAKDAEAVAQAYLDGDSAEQRPIVRPLAGKNMTGAQALKIKSTSCEVAVLARPIVGSALPARFAWKRPVSQTALGPLAQCEDGAADKQRVSGKDEPAR